MKDSVPPLPDELQRLLEVERSAPPESDEVRTRAVARATVAFREGGVAPVRPLFRRRVPLLAAAALAALVALGAFAAYRWVGTSEPGTEPSGASHAIASAPFSVSPAKAPAGPSAEAATTAEAPASPARAPEPSATARRPSPDETYALELALLQRARAAVAKGNDSTALDAILEHQRRFPAGRLREEREALRVKALAGLGRKDEARRAAERFKTEFPRSVLSSSIEQTSRPPR